MIRRAQYCRRIAQRRLDQAIEVRGEDNANDILGGKHRDGSVRRGGPLGLPFALVGARLEAGAQQLLPLGQRLADRVEKVEVVRLLFTLNGGQRALSVQTVAGFTKGLDAQGQGLLGQNGFFDRYNVNFQQSSRLFTISGHF